MTTQKLDKELRDSDTLPFSAKQQLAALGHLISDTAFFYLCKSRIKPEQFHDPNSARIWKALLDFEKSNKRLPKSIEEFQSAPDFTCEDQQMRTRLYIQIAAAANEATFHGRDVLETRVKDWVQAFLFVKQLREGAALYEKGDLEAAIKLSREGLRKIDEVSLDDEKWDHQQWRTQFAEAATALENACTFGVRLMDKHLNPAATNGSLLAGDCTVLLAPQNVGKTTSMLTIIKHNLMIGKSILFLVHEGNKVQIMQKLWMNMLGSTQRELGDGIHNKDKEADYQMVADMLTPQLDYIYKIKAGQTIEEIDSLVRARFTERKSRTGKGYDMIVDDYAATLTTERASKGNLAKRHIDDIVYSYPVAWAGEFNCHVLTAIQANREAAKINKGITHHGTKSEDGGALRILVPEDVSESFGPVQRATNVITINRDENATNQNWVIFHIGKSRSSMTGTSVICQSDFARGISHSDDLKSTTYTGTATMSSRVNDFLHRFNQGEVPDGAMFSVL